MHRELQQRVGLRVHNTLFELVSHGRIGCVPHRGEHLYVSSDAERAASQIARRSDLSAAAASVQQEAELGPATVIEVLLEVIHGSVVQLDAEKVAARLVARGVAVTVGQVEAVFHRHGVVKKTAQSRSPRLRP